MAEWLTQGRKLQAEGRLPTGVVLPEPEIDWEKYRPAFEAFFGQLPCDQLHEFEKDAIRSLIAAMPLMPKD